MNALNLLEVETTGLHRKLSIITCLKIDDLRWATLIFSSCFPVSKKANSRRQRTIPAS